MIWNGLFFFLALQYFRELLPIKETCGYWRRVCFSEQKFIHTEKWALFFFLCYGISLCQGSLRIALKETVVAVEPISTKTARDAQETKYKERSELGGKLEENNFHYHGQKLKIAILILMIYGMLPPEGWGPQWKTVSFPRRNTMNVWLISALMI